MNEQREKFLQEAVRFSDGLQEAYKRVTEKNIDHKLSLLKDYNNLSVLVLTGATSVLAFGQGFIKTPLLFILSSIIMGSVILVNFFLQRGLFDKEEELSLNLEKFIDKLSGRITKFNLEKTDEHFNELREIVSESSKPLVSSKSWFLKNGQGLVFLLFLLGFLGLILSLLIKIETSI